MRAQALPLPPGGRGWAPPLHRLHSSSALSALVGAPSSAPGALGMPSQAPGAPLHPPLRPGAAAPESRKRSFAAALEDGELPGLPPGTRVPDTHEAERILTEGSM